MAKAKKVVKKRVKPAPKKVAVNKLFPGQPDYVGPQTGWFGFVHHAELFEHSYEPIRNRVQYILGHKPSKEIKTRLNHLIYLGENLGAKIEKVNDAAARATHSRYASSHGPLRTAVKAYAKKHIVPFCWNGHSLAYDEGTGREFTG